MQCGVPGPRPSPGASTPRWSKSIAAVCGRIRTETKLDIVVLSGGVFLNALLTREGTSRLRKDGFRVYRHRQVPPNDGGLSLGQLAVAAASSEPRP